MSEILGVLFAFIVGAIAIPTFSKYQELSNENLRDAATAQQAVQFNTASTSYIQQNSVAVQAAATATTPAVITVPMLQAVNLLPSSFSATNPYGQTWKLEVLQPAAGNLQALAMSTGGTVISDKHTSKIASLIGASGGFIPHNDSGLYAGGSGNAYGAYSGWTVPTTNFTTITDGTVASLLTFNNGQLANNYLYRNAVPGQPQLNQMNTPIIMASVQTLNSACTSIGAIAQDGNGGVLSCQNPGSTWQQQGSAYWKDPVVNFASLPACTATTAWQTRIVRVPTTGSGPRAYTCDGTSSSWKALAVDDSGNMTIAGTVTFGKAQVNTVVTAGAACSPNGLVARDAVGLILSCQSGVYKTGTGSLTTVTVSSGGWATSASVACPATYTMVGGSCNMYRGGDGREVSPRTCAPSGNGYFCAEGNSGYCVAYAVCAK